MQTKRDMQQKEGTPNQLDFIPQNSYNWRDCQHKVDKLCSGSMLQPVNLQLACRPDNYRD